LKFRAPSTLAVAAFRAFDFERIAKPDAVAAAAPMTCHMALGHAEMTGHRAYAEILETTDAPRWRGARQGEMKHVCRDGSFVVCFAHFDILGSEIIVVKRAQSD
jgi:hypothetical protein